MKETVTFRNGTLKMAGHLYLPDTIKEEARYPAIVCMHPSGGVKEQVIGLYARQLAERGFIALAFDASHQGESEGLPRLLEDPVVRVEDARCAIDYLSTLSFVDESKIGVLGVGEGGGYAISAAKSERRLRAVATISAVDIGGGSRDFLGDGVPAAENWATLDAVAKQRTAEARGAQPLLIKYVPDSPEEITEGTPDFMREGYEYYRTPRGQHPNAPNRYLFRSLDRILAFSAFDLIPRLLTQPLLLIAGSEADTLLYSEQAYDLANADDDVLHIVRGATHVALYDVPEYVDQAMEKLTEFFTIHLRGS